MASHPGWPFPFLEASMNPIPLIASIIVRAALEWFLED